MKIAVLICRGLLGLGFMVFGLNILHPFLPQPPFPEGSLPAQFMGVMGPTHYMEAVGVFQFVGGLLVLIGCTAPLGLTILGPVLVNILLFHFFIMEGAGLGPGIVFCVLEAFLIYAYRDNFRPIWTRNARPHS